MNEDAVHRYSFNRKMFKGNLMKTMVKRLQK